MSSKTEKSHLESKKFVAYLAADVTWSILLGLAVWNLDRESLGATGILMAMIITKGFVQVGYILGQAALDKYVRTATILAESRKVGDAGASP